jgi:choline dehydrogenase
MHEHDFIVVGSGAAGSVLADRLSRDGDASVLVLESGGWHLPESVHAPSRWHEGLGSDLDWRYETVPQPGLGGRRVREPRGRRSGGSSNLYIMMHVRGHRSDFDTWAYGGAPGWSYDDVLPYFQRLEDQEDDTGPHVGKGGPMPLLNAGLHDPLPVSAAFIEACKELGFSETADFNGEAMEGAGWHRLNIHDGRRCSARTAFLEPSLGRPNLAMEADAHATRLLFDGRRCVGVEYLRDDAHLERAYARCEVVVCAGAIESPKLLMLSGIGDRRCLRRLGLPSVADLPGVGENFHNHVLLVAATTAKRELGPSRLNDSECALFWKSHPGWVGPDMQQAFVRMTQAGPRAVAIIPGVVRPMSRGTVRLANADPLAMPLLDPRYLTATIDRERLIQGTRLAQALLTTTSLLPWLDGGLVGALSGRRLEQHASGDEVRAFVTENADSYHHQAGSCKMGSDEWSVVDPELRVHGIDALRVADASVMPTVPSGNCHAAIMMIAERASEFVRGAEAPFRARETA